MKKHILPTTFAFTLPSRFGFPLRFFKTLPSSDLIFWKIYHPFQKKGLECRKLYYENSSKNRQKFDSFCAFVLEFFGKTFRAKISHIFMSN